MVALLVKVTMAVIAPLVSQTWGNSNSHLKMYGHKGHCAVKLQAFLSFLRELFMQI